MDTAKKFIERVIEYATMNDDKYLYDLAMWANSGGLDNPPEYADYSNPPIGGFEFLTKEEHAEIQDDGFEKVYQSLNLKFPTRDDMIEIKNLLHHVWSLKCKK